jgi:hypothetical protein
MECNWKEKYCASTPLRASMQKDSVAIAGGDAPFKNQVVV